MALLLLTGCLSKAAILQMTSDGVTAPEAAIICCAILGTCWALGKILG